MENPKQTQWVVLAILAFVAVASVVFNGNPAPALALMALSYLSNTSYSLVSRSGVRDSALYHGLTVLLSNLLFYSVLHNLNANNLTLALFVPYTVATVYGSFTGATLSMKVEEYFGITTDPKKKDPSHKSYLAKRMLLVVLGVLTIWFAASSRNIALSLTIAGLMFVNDAVFSLLRRARNSDNVSYHIVISLLQSASWYLLYRNLSLNQMAFTLFPAYCFGSVMGNLFGQELSSRIEKMIGASANAHLSSAKTDFMPWKEIGILVVIAAAFIVFNSGALAVLGIVGFGIAQQISFSIVSRSRQRNNMMYHIIASIFSNGVWFLTFRQIQHQEWLLALYVPYAAGTAIGSIMGVGVSMGIEKRLNIVSDSRPAPSKA